MKSNLGNESNGFLPGLDAGGAGPQSGASRSPQQEGNPPVSSEPLSPSDDARTAPTQTNNATGTSSALVATLTGAAHVLGKPLFKMFPGLKTLVGEHRPYTEGFRIGHEKMEVKLAESDRRIGRLNDRARRFEEAYRNDLFAAKRSIGNLSAIAVQASLIVAFPVASIFVLSSEFIQANSPTGNHWGAYGIAFSLWSGVAVKYYAEEVFHVTSWLFNGAMGLVALSSFGVAAWQVCKHFAVHVSATDTMPSFEEMVSGVQSEPVSYALLITSLLLLEWSAIYGLTCGLLKSLAPPLDPFNLRIDKELDKLDQKRAIVTLTRAGLVGKVAAFRERKKRSNALVEAFQAASDLIKKIIKNS